VLPFRSVQRQDDLRLGAAAGMRRDGERAGTVRVHGRQALAGDGEAQAARAVQRTVRERRARIGKP